MDLTTDENSNKESVERFHDTCNNFFEKLASLTVSSIAFIVALGIAIFIHNNNQDYTFKIPFAAAFFHIVIVTLGLSLILAVLHNFTNLIKRARTKKDTLHITFNFYIGTGSLFCFTVGWLFMGWIVCTILTNLMFR